MFNLGLVLGFLIGVGAMFFVAMLYIVLGGLTRAGEHAACEGECKRRKRGRRWAKAEVRREARRQHAINKELARIEAQQQKERVGAEC